MRPMVNELALATSPRLSNQLGSVHLQASRIGVRWDALRYIKALLACPNIPPHQHSKLRITMSSSPPLANPGPFVSTIASLSRESVSIDETVGGIKRQSESLVNSYYNRFQIVSDLKTDTESFNTVSRVRTPRYRYTHHCEHAAMGGGVAPIPGCRLWDR